MPAGTGPDQTGPGLAAAGSTGRSRVRLLPWVGKAAVRRITGGSTCRYPMAEPPTAAAPEVAPSAQDVLLATKLHVPRPQPGVVPRPRLAGQLDEGLGRGLVLVCAPA